MRPPQLHVVLICLRRAAKTIDKIEQSAVFLIPTGMDRVIKNLNGLRKQCIVLCDLRLLHQEPAAFDIMSGINNAASRRICLQFSFRSDRFQRTLEFRFYMIAQDLLYALLRACIVKCALFRITAAHDCRYIQINHRISQSAARARLRDRFGAKSGRVFDQMVIELINQLIRSPRTFDADMLPGIVIILGVCHCIKRLGEAVAPLAQRMSVSRHSEIHPVPDVAVDAVRLHKVKAAPADLQPFLALSIVCAQICVCPCAASLHPYAFVCAVNFPGFVKAGINTAVFMVYPILAPEFDGALQFFLHPTVISLHCLHTCSPFH